ncbi:AzlD family protein [Gellertiella hungarica]|uniref:Putative membrane protein n=1 Tax=Gellertiella hungarica TaxID=1572859 RepID=A0A7W6J2H8_9HYPH|nr:AzlD family protein [Gellertiella hungarica]MBB4063570.1 putative membrane protein [Gellertiella hungarica]
MDGFLHLDMLILILAAAVATFATRIGGYFLITRMKTIPPRLDAALNAVPAAVLTTLVAPNFYAGGPELKIAMAVALVVGLRFNVLTMLAAGWVVVMALRHGGGW